MKHLKIALLALTLVFSVAAIAAPKTDKTPKAPKANKTHKATKADAKKPAFTCYYFQVSNTVAVNACNPSTNPITLVIPTTIPPTSVSGCTGTGHYCYVGFPNYVADGLGNYYPADANGTQITNYCTFTCFTQKS